MNLKNDFFVYNNDQKEYIFVSTCYKNRYLMSLCFKLEVIVNLIPWFQSFVGLHREWIPTMKILSIFSIVIYQPLNMR
jgi:hypothetical protein